MIEMHVHLYNNIVLSGGSCLFPGFRDRLYVFALDVTFSSSFVLWILLNISCVYV